MNEEKNINLLSKLLAEPKNYHLDNNAEKFDKMLDVFTKDFAPLLSSSVYDSKSNIISEIRDVFAILETILLVPNIIGKNLIAIFTDKYSSKNDIFKIIFKDKCNYVEYNNNLPCIILDSDKREINSINVFGSSIRLENDEYYFTNRELYKNKIDVRKFINVFHIAEPLNYVNIAFLYLPFYVQKNRFLKSILHILNSAIIIGNQTNSEYILRGENHIDYYRLSVTANGGIDDTSKKRLKLWLDSKNNKSYNIICSIKMDIIFTKMLRKLKEKAEECLSLYTMFVEESIFSDNESSIKEFISEQKKNFLDTKKRIYEDIENIKRIYVHIINELEQIEDSLVSVDADFVIDNKVEAKLLTLAVEKYLLGEIDSCLNCRNKLNTFNSKRCYLVDMYIKFVEGRFITKDELMMLEYEDSDIDFIKELKIRYRKDINIGASELSKLYSSALYLSNVSAEDYDEIGDYYFAKGFRQKAEKFYFKALEMGKTEVKNKIIRISQDCLPRIKRKFVEIFDSNEIFRLGVEQIKNSKVYSMRPEKRTDLYKEGYANICIAVSLENSKALNYLAQLHFEKIESNGSKVSDRDISICVGLCLELLKKNFNCDNTNYKLGYLFEIQNDLIKAEEYYNKAKTDLAYYRLGSIYLDKKKSTKSSLKKAKSFFNKAKKLGYNVDTELAVINRREAELDEKLKKVKEDREEPVVSTTVTDEGFCFITTATMRALGKGDESAELRELHDLRDKFLLSDTKGEILLKEYYRIAPILVRKVNQLSNSDIIYKEIYNKYIKKTYELSLCGEDEKARFVYIDMMLELCKRYNVKINDEVLNIITLL